MARTTSTCRFLFHRLPLGLAAALLLIGVAINFANVVARYLFRSAFYGAEEAMIYMAIWSIFLAAVAVAYEKADLTMDFFASRVGPGARRLVEGLISAVTVAVCLFMAWQSLALLRRLFQNEQRSLALEVPMVVPQASLLIGFLLIAAAVMARFLDRDASDEARPDAPAGGSQS